MNYRTLAVYNNTAVNLGYYYDNEPTEVVLRGDTLRVSVPKKTDFKFTLYSSNGTCFANLYWYNQETMNLSENELYRVFMNDEVFALFTANNSGETIDKIEVNLSTCPSDIYDGESYFIGFFINATGNNYIRWYNKSGAYLFVDDNSNYPVAIRPLNDSNPNINLIVDYTIPSFSKLEPPIPYSSNSKENNILLFNSSKQDQEELTYIRGEIERIK